MFQQNSVLRAGGAAQALQQKSTPSSMLNQISSQIIDRQDGLAEMESASKAQELKRDAYVKIETSQALDEAPREIVEYYAHVFKIFSNSSTRQENNLIAFKEKLQDMDATIQGYQDIMDGKSALPEGMGIEDISQSLESAKQTRAQFWNDGVKHLNKWGDDWVTSDAYDCHANKVLGENKFAGMDSSYWKLDASAADPYAEIDRALAATQSVTKELGRGIDSLTSLLKKHGYGEEYQRYLQSRNTQVSSFFDYAQAATVQQLMLDHLKSMPLQEA